MRKHLLPLLWAALFATVQAASAAGPAVYFFKLNKTEYGWATTLAVGTPPQTFQAMIDTGSGLVWLPAPGCGANCSQSLAGSTGFDASASSTFQAVPCGDLSCNATFCQECACSATAPGSCGYSLEYMEGAKAFGDWVQDSLELSGLVVADKANASLKFGLQQGTTGDLRKQSIPALVGLNAEPTSIVSQLSAQGTIEDGFSYCLDDVGHHLLVLGVPRNASGSALDFQFLPLLMRNNTNPLRRQTMYLVELTALGLGSAGSVPVPQLPISANASLAMAMIDSGTSLLALTPNMTQAFGEAVLAAAQEAHLPLNSSVTDGICFQGVTLDEAAAVLPPLTFTFGNGVNVTVPADNYLAPAPEQGAPCVAVEPSSTEFPILGAKALQKVAVAVRNSDATLGFKRVRRCIDLLEFEGNGKLESFQGRAENSAAA